MSRDARTCRLYRDLLLEYLTDRTRSGRHFLDGQKYATAALSCMKYLRHDLPWIWADLRPYYWPTSQLSLIYIRHLLPRAARTNELIEFAKTRPLAAAGYAEKFPEDTKLAEKAIADFIAGVPVLPPPSPEAPTLPRDLEFGFCPNVVAGPSNQPSNAPNSVDSSASSQSSPINMLLASAPFPPRQQHFQFTLKNCSMQTPL